MRRKETPLVKKYKNWRLACPQAFILFEKLANEVRAAGYDRYSAKTIFENLRWHSQIEKVGEFKLDNNYVRLMAQELIEKDPTFQDFFAFRRSNNVL